MGRCSWGERLKPEDLEEILDIIDKYMRRGHRPASGAEWRVWLG